MNESIKELAEQFRMNFSINGNPQDGIHWDDVDEFAELIVKECAIAYHKTRLTNTPIKTHFRDHLGIRT